MTETNLFTPFTLDKLKLPNRVVMAPMTRGRSPDGIPGPNVAAYYRRRAEGNVGLILTEGTLIGQDAAGNNAAWPHFYGEEALAGWANVLAEVKEAGGRIMPQLWHVGITRKPGSEPNPQAPSVSPSGISLEGEQVGEPLTQRGIDELIEAYASAAAAAQRMGFDGIELHGAHGYLIDQFFWERTNKRTDGYGGDLVGRTRFAVQVIEECRRRTGPDFPIMLRFSQWKSGVFDARLANDPKELERFLAPLSAAGVDIFHCSTRRFWEPAFEGSDLNLAGWTKKVSGKPTITVGSVGLNSEFTATRGGVTAEVTDLDRLLTMLARGDFDLVAVGRSLLVDPNWANKVRDGRFDEISKVTPESLGVYA